MSEDLIDQINRLVQEVQHYRVKSDNDDKTIGLMEKQYDELAGGVDAMRDKYEREIFALKVERDTAITKHSKIKGLLLQSTDLVMAALKADKEPPLAQPLPAPTQPNTVTWSPSAAKLPQVASPVR